MKRRGIFFLCVIYIFIVICGCGAKETSGARLSEGKTDGAAREGKDEAAGAAEEGLEQAQQEAKELVPVRVAVQEYYVSSSIGYIMENKLDEAFGLKLELVMYPSGAEQILDIEEDVYDVATIGAAFLYPLAEDQAVLIGEHIKSVGGNAIYAREDSPILDVKGFNPIYQEVYGDPATVKGSTILIKENTTSQYLGMKWLESIGVKAESVNIEYMDFDQMYQEFSDGCGDVAVLAAPNSYQAEKDGYVRVATTESLYINMYEVIIATNRAYEEKQDTLVKFLELLLYANEQLEEDFTQKMDSCGKWYEDNKVAFTRNVLKQECRDKLFVTRDNYSIEEFGEFEYKYAEYMAAIGNIPPAQLKNVKKNMDSELFREALAAAESSG